MGRCSAAAGEGAKYDDDKDDDNGNDQLIALKLDGDKDDDGQNARSKRGVQQNFDKQPKEAAYLPKIMTQCLSKKTAEANHDSNHPPREAPRRSLTGRGTIDSRD